MMNSSKKPSTLKSSVTMTSDFWTVPSTQIQDLVKPVEGFLCSSRQCRTLGLSPHANIIKTSPDKWIIVKFETGSQGPNTNDLTTRFYLENYSSLTAPC